MNHWVKSFLQKVAAANALLVGLSLSGCCGNHITGHNNISAEKYIPPTIAQLTNDWIGISSLHAEVYKLTVTTDGTGVLAEASSYGILQFAITNCTIDSNGVLNCTFDTMDDIHYPVQLTCRISKSHLDGTLSNGKGGWTRRITFLRFKELKEQVSTLEAIRASGPGEKSVDNP